MSNYTKTTNFATKDSLPSGDANKIVKGAEINTEFDNIATAVATKSNTASPTFTGTVTIPTADINGGAIDGTTIGGSSASAVTATTLVANTSLNIASDGATVTGIKDEDDMSSNSATKLATQQSIKAYVDSQVTAQDLDVTTDSGTIAIDLDSETLTVTGGTGLSSSATGNAVTLNIDSTVATLTGTQTLTNKTLTAPTISGNLTTDGTIDGRDVATDGTKLDGIESNATADQTAAEIRTLVGSATDSNVFTDADHSKLDGIEASATADQTASEIRALVESASDSNVFTDADHSKLDGIEASADVTDTANVTAAGALMDSECTSLASVKALNQGVATTDSPSFAGLTVDTNTLSVDATNNRVGIGTTTPSYPLEINHTGANTTALTLNDKNTVSNATGLYLRSTSEGRISVGSGAALTFANNGGLNEAMRIDSSGNVGIGTSSPQSDGNTTNLEVSSAFGARVLVANTDTNGRKYGFYSSNSGIFGLADYTASGTPTRMAIDSSGRVGIGTSSPSSLLHLSSAGSTVLNVEATGANDSRLRITSGNNNISYVEFADPDDVDTGEIRYEHATNNMQFRTAGNVERMRIDSSGNLLVGTTQTDVGYWYNRFGCVIEDGGQIHSAVSGDACAVFNRNTNDGEIVELRQGGNKEGSISVSGSTVSYNGFAGRHESSGISLSTEKGTVVSTIDELDTYLSGVKQGQTRADHAKVKVSDIVGDSCVYGVVDDFTDEGKVNVISVGIGAVRVTGSCAKGDLLESNGDGTARVQPDDIVRNKTIGKVTIGNNDTDVKLVSCVLYCG